MTPERWREIERVYHDALTLSGPERAAFLAKVSAADAPLRSEVDSLLAHASTGEHFLTMPAMDVAAQGFRAGAAFAADHQFGGYVILSRLGAGGMGEVYRARDTTLGREVAIKILPSVLTAGPDRLARFEREARMLAALNHPHIGAIYGVEEAEGVRALVLELVEGETLADLLARQAQGSGLKAHGLPLNDALGIARQIADALEAAHEKGIVHRDLKPANIQITPAGVVKVLDFGLAKALSDDGAGVDLSQSPTVSVSGTREGVILGTPAYMSPEQARGKAVDKRTDIWAFGCVVYEMLTGRAPFVGDTVSDVLAKILERDPDWRALSATTPAGVRRLLLRCLEKDPKQRLRDIGDARMEIDAALDERKRLDPDRELRDQAPAEVLTRDRASGARPSRIVGLFPPRAHLRAWLALGATTALVLAVAVAPPFPVLVSAPPTPVPLTTYPGFEQEPTFSPDGNQVAFVWNGEKQDNRDIYVMLIGSGRPLRLTTEASDDFSPAWSPDGRSIAFLRGMPGDKAALLLVPPLGGPERKLAEVSAPGWWMRGPYVAWSPDSTALVVIDRTSPTDPFSLFLFSVEGGEKRRLTSPPAGAFNDTGPAFSHDGRSLAFSRALGLGDVYLLPLTAALTPAGEPKQLTFGDQGATSPSWLDRGFWSLPGNRRDIVFSPTWGRTGLWRISASGSRAAESLAFAGQEASYPTISVRSHRLVYARSFSDVDVWRFNMASGSSSPLIASTRNEVNAEFSPDGTRVTFGSDRSGFDEIWVSDSEGSNAVQLTSMMAPMTGAPCWSPDGNRIVFDSNLEGQFEVYAIGAGGGKPQRLTTHPGNDMAASWSHDGRWIYFASNRSGDFQIWRMPASGGNPLQVTRAGGFISRESPDGKYLYYNRTVGSRGSLWRVPVGGGEETKVLELVIYRYFAVTTEGIYFLTDAGVESEGAQAPVASLQFLSFTTARTKQIATLEKPSFGLSLSPDHQWILYSRVVQEGSDLMLVENFR